MSSAMVKPRLGTSPLMNVFPRLFGLSSKKMTSCWKHHYESWDLGLRRNLNEAEILSGLFYPPCESPLIDPWWMIHGDGTLTSPFTALPNLSPNTLHHVVIIRMLLFIKKSWERYHPKKDLILSLGGQSW